MALFEGKTPAERNKTIAALLLPLIALVLLLRVFFASDKPKQPTPPRKSATSSSRTMSTSPAKGGAPDAADGEQIEMPQPVTWQQASYSVPDAARNIFAYYAPAVSAGAAKAAATPTEPPTPTPTPPPPLVLSAVQPASVFARTEGSPLEASGDKFTPQTRIYVDGQELQTTFKSPQQLTASLPAALLQAPGTRAVVVRTPDSLLYSNTSIINVMPPPTPQYTFVGLFGHAHYQNDKALLKPTAGNELLTIQRGDVVGGRFKVVSISDRTVELVDTQLKIKHTLPYTDAKSGVAGGPAPRYPQPAASDDDDEP